MEINPQDFVPNELRLEKDWIRQSTLNYMYGEHLAECIREHDRAKNRLELVKTQCLSMLRKNPAAHGLTKRTDKAVESHLPSMQLYQEAQEEVVQARYDMEMARVALHSIETKKRSLEKLVELFLSNYYSEPQAAAEAESVSVRREGIVNRRRRRRKEVE